MNHLFVVCHYDDEVFSSAGTISKLVSQGDIVTVLYIARRVTNHNPDSRKGIDLQKRAEDACKILGASVLTPISLYDEHLYGDMFLRMIDVIEDAIKCTNPQSVWTHWGQDFNQDHRSVSEAVEIATRRMIGIKNIYHFEVPTATELCPRAFEPNVYVELSEEQVAAKLKAVSCYDTELHQYRSLGHVKTYLEFRGLAIGVKNAEAFRLVRSKL